MENATSDDETYWLGEEFRKGTPLFSRDLYKNLPDLLDNCISLSHRKILSSRLRIVSPTPPCRPLVRILKNPDIIRHFVEELPDTFTTDEALLVGAKHEFSHRKVTRLLKALN